jgi:hypothetical protein
MKHRFTLVVKGKPQKCKAAAHQRHIQTEVLATTKNNETVLSVIGCKYDVQTTLNKWFCETMAPNCPVGSLMLWSDHECARGS